MRGGSGEQDSFMDSSNRDVSSAGGLSSSTLEITEATVSEKKYFNTGSLNAIFNYRKIRTEDRGIIEQFITFEIKRNRLESVKDFAKRTKIVKVDPELSDDEMLSQGDEGYNACVDEMKEKIKEVLSEIEEELE